MRKPLGLEKTRLESENNKRGLRRTLDTEIHTLHLSGTLRLPNSLSTSRGNAQASQEGMYGQRKTRGGSKVTGPKARFTQQGPVYCSRKSWRPRRLRLPRPGGSTSAHRGGNGCLAHIFSPGSFLRLQVDRQSG